MRYLKSYAFYESLSKVLDQSIIDECKDILLELEDKGIKTNVRSYFNTGISTVTHSPTYRTSKKWIQFFFSRKKEFDYSDIEDVVERLKSYLSESNLHIEWQEPIERKENKPIIKRVMNPETFSPEGVKTECALYFK
jgi:hypothetical protein